jgi:hypothetical protein
LRTEWIAAKAKLGSPTPNFGHPDIQPIPSGAQNHITTLYQQPWMAQALQGPYQGSTLQLVEIDPLLAFQFHVDISRADHHCIRLTRPPPLIELLELCLPITLPNESVQFSPGSNSLVIRSRSLNLQTQAQGLLQQNVAGVAFGLSLHLVQVVRYNTRCYLHNGFHRAYGARMAGATHIPCVFRDVPTSEMAGIRTDGRTFPLSLLESSNPPTIGHFTSGRAYQIQLRAFSRIITVSWADHVVPEE